PRVRNQRVEVLEEGETVRFLHRVVPGGADRSYGIHVAALAGLPSGVIARARQVLPELERQRPLEPPEQQLGLPMEMAPDPLRKELEELEPDSLSPLEALQKLYELRSRLNTGRRFISWRRRWQTQSPPARSPSGPPRSSKSW